MNTTIYSNLHWKLCFLCGIISLWKILLTITKQEASRNLPLAFFMLRPKSSAEALLSTLTLAGGVSL